MATISTLYKHSLHILKTGVDAQSLIISNVQKMAQGMFGLKEPLRVMEFTCCQLYGET